jgi:Sporulation and spore germination
MISRRLQLAIVLLFTAVFGAGVYVLQLKHHAEESVQRAPDLRPLPPPVSGPSEHVILYLPDDTEGILRKHGLDMPLPADRSERAREVLRALVAACQDKSSLHPLGEGADINTVFIVNQNTAVVDTNAAFADHHRSGILVEELTVASLVRTLAANVPGITRVRVLVQGNDRETLAGHADLTAFFDVAVITDAIKEAQ